MPKRIRGSLVPVRGLNRVRAKGRVYYYHRKTGVRLRSAFGSAAFFAEVAALDMPQPSPVRRGAPGTWGALALAYRASPEYLNLAVRTRSDYDKVLDYLAGPIDAMPLAQLDSAAILGVRDKAFEQRKRRFANHVLQVIGTVMNWGEPRKLSHSYPLAGKKRIKIARPRDLPRANRPWLDAETEIVLREAPPNLRVSIALAIYAGMRGGDIAWVPWSIYDGHALTWRQNKTGEEVWVPCLPELKTILDAAPRTATTISTRRDGRPATKAGIDKAFRTVILRLLREEKIGPGLTLHGRRHTLGDALMSLGAELSHVQAILGQKSISAAQHYSRGAGRKRAATAAIELLANARRTKLQNSGG